MVSGSFGSASQAYGSMTVSPWWVRSKGTCFADGGGGTVLIGAKSMCHASYGNGGAGGPPATISSPRRSTAAFRLAEVRM